MKISDQLYEEAEHYNTDPRVVQEIDPDSIKKLADKVKELENGFWKKIQFMSISLISIFDY